MAPKRSKRKVAEATVYTSKPLLKQKTFGLRHKTIIRPAPVDDAPSKKKRRAPVEDEEPSKKRRKAQTTMTQLDFGRRSFLEAICDSQEDEDEEEVKPKKADRRRKTEGPQRTLTQFVKGSSGVSMMVVQDSEDEEIGSDVEEEAQHSPAENAVVFDEEPPMSGQRFVATSSPVHETESAVPKRRLGRGGRRKKAPLRKKAPTVSKRIPSPDLGGGTRAGSSVPGVIFKTPRKRRVLPVPSSRSPPDTHLSTQRTPRSDSPPPPQRSALKEISCNIPSLELYPQDGTWKVSPKKRNRRTKDVLELQSVESPSKSLSDRPNMSTWGLIPPQAKTLSVQHRIFADIPWKKAVQPVDPSNQESMVPKSMESFAKPAPKQIKSFLDLPHDVLVMGTSDASTLLPKSSSMGVIPQSVESPLKSSSVKPDMSTWGPAYPPAKKSFLKPTTRNLGRRTRSAGNFPAVEDPKPALGGPDMSTWGHVPPSYEPPVKAPRGQLDLRTGPREDIPYQSPGRHHIVVEVEQQPWTAESVAHQESPSQSPPRKRPWELSPKYFPPGETNTQRRVRDFHERYRQLELENHARQAKKIPQPKRTYARRSDTGPVRRPLQSRVAPPVVDTQFMDLGEETQAMLNETGKVEAFGDSEDEDEEEYGSEEEGDYASGEEEGAEGENEEHDGSEKEAEEGKGGEEIFTGMPNDASDGDDNPESSPVVKELESIKRAERLAKKTREENTINLISSPVSAVEEYDSDVLIPSSQSEKSKIPEDIEVNVSSSLSATNVPEERTATPGTMYSLPEGTPRSNNPGRKKTKFDTQDLASDQLLRETQARVERVSSSASIIPPSQHEAILESPVKYPRNDLPPASQATTVDETMPPSYRYTQHFDRHLIHSPSKNDPIIVPSSPIAPHINDAAFVFSSSPLVQPPELAGTSSSPRPEEPRTPHVVEGRMKGFVRTAPLRMSQLVSESLDQSLPMPPNWIYGDEDEDDGEL